MSERRVRWKATWDRDLPRLCALIAVVGVIWITLWQLHPNLLLSSSSTTGGDTGAHFIFPAFIKSTLLSHGHLTGWYPYWYDGFPVYTYYFVLPDLIAALASFVISYGVAFKLATILGAVLTPIAAYVMGKLFGLKAPLPSALAVAMLPFLFDPTFTIDGGNLFSTLAGEYAFSLSLALSMIVIGLVARGVRTGRGSIVTPVLLAACIASHIIPVAYALVGSGVVLLIALLPAGLLPGDEVQGASRGLLESPRLSRPKALWWSVRSLGLGVGLSGWWLVPFATSQLYANPMGYSNDTDFGPKLLPSADTWVLLIAAVGVVLCVWRRSRFGVTIASLGIIWGVAFIVDPQGSIWNERFIPLWYISVYLMAGWTIGVVVADLARWWRRRRLDRFFDQLDRSIPAHRPTPARWLPGAVMGPLVMLGLVIVVVVPPLVPSLVSPSSLESIGITPGANQVSSWAEWNYSGYEGKASYPEYRALMSTMGELGQRYGCGRAMWEYNSNLNRFGTPMALMLLPYWTDGCIGSQEGLFFEASATTPYHFLTQAEVSTSPSDPQVGLPYGPVDVGLGVEHLQLLGVKYFMASSPDVTAQANEDPSLTKVATSGPWPLNDGTTGKTTWTIYLIHDAPVVESLTHLPVVVPGIDASSKSWLNANVDWFLDPARWEVPLAASGPASWPRGTISTKTSPWVTPTTVDHIAVGTSSVGFDVGHLGVPVLVRVSYYPRWHVSGAEGPYRVSPNLMVVIPMSHHVELTYGEDPADVLGLLVTAASLVGLVAVGVLSLRRRRHRKDPLAFI